MMKMIFSLHLLNVAYSIETHETVIIIITIIKRNITQKKKKRISIILYKHLYRLASLFFVLLDIITVTCDQDTP